MSINLKDCRIRCAAFAAAAVLICVLAMAWTAPEKSFADCMEPGADVSAGEARCTSEVGERITPDMIPDRSEENGSGLSLDSGETKYIPLLVIVIGFNNMAYSDDYDWHESFFSNDFFSIAKYYKEMSFGQVSFSPVPESSAYGLDGNTNSKDKANDGVIHVTVDRDHKDWGEYDGPNGASMIRAYRDAVLEADRYADMTVYDSNGDGKLSAEEFAVVFVVAGYDHGSAYTSKDRSLYLRSHRWSFSGVKKSLDMKGFSAPQVTRDKKTVTVNNYVCAAENCEKAGGTIKQGRKGSIAHELGHHLGLPDLYDTTSGDPADRPWENYEVNHVSLMGSGSWGEDSSGEFRPYSLDPWSRIFLGWTTPETITALGSEAVTYVVNSQNYMDLSKGKTILRVNMPYSGEYYLIEARYTERWDSEIMKLHYKGNKTKNSRGGLIFWHVDENVLEECYNAEAGRYYDVNAAAHRPGVMPLYPELVGTGSGGVSYSLIGDGGNGNIYNERPFFDLYVMENSYSTLGTELDLPTYVGLKTSSLPKDRQNSGIRIEIGSDASTSMFVKIIGKSHIHNWENSYSGVTPDICQNGGTYKLTQTCYKCNQYREFTYAHDAGTHFSLKHVPALSPTCEYAGYKEHYECSNCYKVYSDPKGVNEVSMLDLVMPGGHEWDDGTVYEQPTYYHDGTMEYRCKLCGDTRWESIPKLDHDTKPGDDGTSCGEGASMQVADKAIRGTKSEKDMPGSRFSDLRATSPKQGKKSIKLSWKNAMNKYFEGADYYYVYGAKCGKNKYKKLATVYGTSVTIKKIGGKALKPKTYYKFVVVAVLGSSDEVMSTSKTVHVATAGSKAKANYTGVSVSSKIVKKAGKMEEGGQLALKAKAKKKKGTTVAKHRGLRYESGNKNVATVTSKGVIKAKSAGQCKIFAYTQNGKKKIIQVEVIND